MTVSEILDAVACVAMCTVAAGVFALAAIGAVVAINAVTLPPPPCRCDCFACKAGPPPDPIDEHSTIVVPSPFPERQ